MLLRGIEPNPMGVLKAQKELWAITAKAKERNIANGSLLQPCFRFKTQNYYCWINSSAISLN